MTTPSAGLLTKPSANEGRIIVQWEGRWFDIPLTMHEALAALSEREADAERLEIVTMEREQLQARFDATIKTLEHIHYLMAPEDIEHDGKRFRFKPPPALLDATWRGLSEAIRKIPDEIAARTAGRDEREPQ